MLNVSEAVKQRYLSDEFNGDYKLTIGNASYTGRNIQQGSLEITESLCSGENIDFSSVEMGQISLTLINFTEGIKDLQGKKLNLVQTVAGEDVPIATEYTVVNAKNSGEYLMEIVANDGLYAFQRDVTDWWNKEVKFPITHRNLLISLCNYCGVQYSIPGTYCNSTLSIKKSIDSDSITALEVLGWLQEVAGCFYRMNRYNVLTARTVTVKRLRPSVGLQPRTGLYPGTINQEWVDEQSVKYTVPQIVSDLEVPDYEVAGIDKLQISGTINDVGVTAGEGTNCYKIVSNPLLFSFSTDELGTIARRIYNVLKGIKYRPFTAKLKGLPYVETGDLVQVTTLKGLVVLCPLLKRTMSGAGLAYDKFECKGNEKREQVTTKTGRNLRVLNQRTHEIINTIDEMSSRITSISTEVDANTTKIEEQSTLIQQTAKEVNLQATRITTINGIVESHTAQIQVNANNIALKVSTSEYNADTIVNMINVDTSGVQIKASKLDLEFGSAASKVTIKATTANDGVLFDGTGKVEFNTKGEFRVKNLDTNGNQANRILATNSSSESSAEIYNYWDNVRANDIDLSGSNTENNIWIVNSRIGEDKNANNIRLYSTSTAHTATLHNFKLTGTDPVQANSVRLEAIDGSNKLCLWNYCVTNTSGTYLSNLVSLESIVNGSVVTNTATIANYRGAGVRANEISMTATPDGTNQTRIENFNTNRASANTLIMDATNYPYMRFVNYQKDNPYSGTKYVASSIYLKQTSNINSFDFYNNRKSATSGLEVASGNHLAMYTDTSSSGSVFRVDNYHWNGNLGNQMDMASYNSSSSFSLRNYNSSGVARSWLTMSGDGTLELGGNTGGTSRLTLNSNGNLDLVGRNVAYVAASSSNGYVAIKTKNVEKICEWVDIDGNGNYFLKGVN